MKTPPDRPGASRERMLIMFSTINMLTVFALLVNCWAGCAASALSPIQKGPSNKTASGLHFPEVQRDVGRMGGRIATEIASAK